MLRRSMSDSQQGVKQFMNKILILLFSISSFYLGFQSGVYKQRNSETYYNSDKVKELIGQIAAYNDSTDLNDMIIWDRLIETKRYEILKIASRDIIRDRIKRLEKIDYSKSPFKDQIEQNIEAAIKHLEAN